MLCEDCFSVIVHHGDYTSSLVQITCDLLVSLQILTFQLVLKPLLDFKAV